MKIKKKSKKKKHTKNKKSNPDIWTEEDYDTYMAVLYDLEYVAGYTPNGVPYGVKIDNDDTEDSEYDNIPF